MPRIIFDEVRLEYPVLDSRRSFRRELGRTIGGAIRRERDSNIVHVVALDGINLTIEKGDRVGLIGHNGAGKSSLLKTIAGVYQPSQGNLTVEGRVTPLLSIGLGLDPDDSGFENIQMCGLLLGMSKREIAAHLPDIIAFSELGEFLSMPMRTYSQGMQMRLAFALATTGHPEILLIDEVIGVGDAEFAAKARARMEDFMERASVLVLASHALDLIRAYCTKALWLEHGRVQAFGPIGEVLDSYQRAI